MKSTFKASRTRASARWPIRHFAMTGIDTASWISRIFETGDIRATPPSRRMSAGTRSSAITAAAPACLGDLRLLGVDDVHDDAALQHLRQAHFQTKRLGHQHGCIPPSIGFFPRSCVSIRPHTTGAARAALDPLCTCRMASPSSAIPVGMSRRLDPRDRKADVGPVLALRIEVLARRDSDAARRGRLGDAPPRDSARRQMKPEERVRAFSAPPGDSGRCVCASARGRRRSERSVDLLGARRAGLPVGSGPEKGRDRGLQRRRASGSRSSSSCGRAARRSAAPRRSSRSGIPARGPSRACRARPSAPASRAASGSTPGLGLLVAVLDDERAGRARRVEHCGAALLARRHARRVLALRHEVDELGAVRQERTRIRPGRVHRERQRDARPPGAPAPARRNRSGTRRRRRRPASVNVRKSRSRPCCAPLTTRISSAVRVIPISESRREISLRSSSRPSGGAYCQRSRRRLQE